MIRSRGWAAASLVLIVTIFVTLQAAPRVWAWLLPLVGEDGPAVAAAAAAGGCAVLGIRAWRLAAPTLHTRRILLIALAVAGAALVLTRVLPNSSPAEKVHLIEYGVLAWWSLNAVETERRGVTLALVVVGLVGVLDEGVQHLLPNRYFDVRDIVANWWATGLGAIAWVGGSTVSPLARRIRGGSCDQS